MNLLTKHKSRGANPNPKASTDFLVFNFDIFFYYLNHDTLFLFQITQVVGGSAAKKYGGKRILSLAVILWSLSTCLVPLFAHSLYTLILSRVILGLGEGLGMFTDQ